MNPSFPYFKTLRSYKHKILKTLFNEAKNAISYSNFLALQEKGPNHPGLEKSSMQTKNNFMKMNQDAVEAAEKVYEQITIGSVVKFKEDIELAVSKAVGGKSSPRPFNMPIVGRRGLQTLGCSKGSTALLLGFEPFAYYKHNASDQALYCELGKMSHNDNDVSNYHILPLWLINNRVYAADIHPIVYELICFGENEHWTKSVKRAKEKIYRHLVGYKRIKNSRKEKRKFLGDEDQYEPSRKDTNIVIHSTNNVYVLNNDNNNPFISVTLPSKDLSSTNMMNLSTRYGNIVGDVTFTEVLPLYFQAIPQ